jgi:hypothetical protein
MAQSGFEKHVIDANSIISYIISVHLWIEYLLTRSLETILPNPGALFKNRVPSFYLLVDLCEAHNIIAPDFANVLRKVNALRNKFVHQLDFEPQQQEIEAVLKALREMDKPFFASYLPGSEKEMAIALASIAGYLERQAREIGETDFRAS